MFLKLFLTAVILVVLDTAYLSWNKKYLESHIQKVQGEPMRIKTESLITCYAIMILGLYYFVIYPKRCIGTAFLLGVFVYGVYETTNYAVFNRWSFDLAIMDTLWGGVLFGLTNAGTTFILGEKLVLLR